MSSRESELHLHERARDAIRLAHQWMQAMRASQRGLSRRLGVDQSLLSRFLSQQPGFEPSLKRPRILALLEAIEQCCSHVEDIDYADLGRPGIDDPFRLWIDAHVSRLRQLRQRTRSGEALTRLPELYAQALSFPPPHRWHACVNTELCLAVVLSHEFEERLSSDSLVRASVEWIEPLERTAAEDLEAAPEATEDRARCHNYAAVARVYAGLRLGDDSLVEAGMEGMLASTKLEHRPLTRVWHNTLVLTNTLLEAEHARADVWVRRVGEEARKTPNPMSLRSALLDRSTERLRTAWEGDFTDLL